MALSGSFGKDVNSHWRLQADWTATQNVSNNESTITLKLYWIADSVGKTDTSATKSGSVSIDGSSSSFSGAGLAKLSNSQKKLIKTYSKTVSHNSDGTKSVSLSAYFDVELSLGGYVGRVSISGTANLNTIPRASTLASTASWTAGNSKPISISRASSSFTHTVRAYVGGTLIKTLTGVASTATFSFSTAENTKIFEELSQGSSSSSKIEVLTYSSGKLIGTTSRAGSCGAPSASTLNMSKSFNIGATLEGSFNSNNSSFVHNLRLYNGNTFLAQLSLLQKSNFSYNTSEIADKLYSLTPNSNTLGLRVILYTMYNGVQVQGGREYSLNALVTNSNPVFSSSQVSYKDTNTTTTTITGNDQYIIQGYSNLSAFVNSGATARNYATISKYEISIGGKTETLSGTGSKAFGKIITNSNTTMSVKVIDSRGNSSLVSKTILVVPYGKPVISPTVKRKNNFENETTLALNGNFSLINIGGAVKNTISTLTYRYRRSGGTYGSLINFSRTISGSTFTASNVVLNLDNTNSFDVEITVKDKLETVVVTKTVSVGKPIFFIDAIKKSLGFNDFPVGANEFRFNGRMIFGSNQWLANSQGEGAGAMFLNNSDITGVNGVFFNDPANNNGEGLMFLKSGKPDASTVGADYDNFRILDGTAFMNNNVVMTDSQGVEEIWSGAFFMNASQSITPSRKLSDCPNGWIMVWSRYANSTTENSFWNFAYVPKRFATLSAGGMVQCLGADPTTNASGVVSKTQPVFKYIYITDTTISGHTQNGVSPNNTEVLRYVYTW